MRVWLSNMQRSQNPLKVIRDTVPAGEVYEIIRFIKTNMGSDHPMSDIELLIHFFKDSVSGDLNLINIMAEEKIIGILGYLKSNMFWGSTSSEIPGVWTSLWVVQKEFRSGVGIVLMRRLQELFPIVLGQGANAFNKKIVSKMRTHFWDNIPRVVFLVRVEKLKAIVPVEHHSLLKKGKISAKHLKHLESVDTVDDNSFSPNWSLYENYKFGTVRNLDYLNWRYFNHPYFKYKCIIGGHKNTPTLLIYRIECTSGIASLRVMRIVEFVSLTSPQYQDQNFHVISSVIKTAEREKCVFIDFYCSNSDLVKVFVKQSFHLEVEKILPSRLDPIEIVSRGQNLEMFLQEDLAKPPWGALYVTKSDGDQDRPNTILQSRG